MLLTKKRKGNPLYFKTKDAAGKRIYAPIENYEMVNKAFLTIRRVLAEHNIDATEAANSKQIETKLLGVPDKIWNALASQVGCDEPEWLRQMCYETLKFDNESNLN